MAGTNTNNMAGTAVGAGAVMKGMMGMMAGMKMMGTTGGGVNGGTMVMMPGGDGRTFPGQGRGVGGDPGSGTGGTFPGDGRGGNPGAPF
ncbi:Hypothetical predicted protein [Mytilus galloprovincialis]|uniref:Uncharacterized protein n=1 Tax=Mytilus galloprovincialis TaxID=29158 RepID=A0A8B6CFJ4_MYTGA|nr:Hypothetical predicted protein [Mytilus galloprovincialis]